MYTSNHPVSLRHRLLAEWADKLEAIGRPIDGGIPIDANVWIEENYLVDRPRDPTTARILPAGVIRLAPYQLRVIREAMSRDSDGKLKYNTILWSEPKKSGKTAIAAAIGMYMATINDACHVYCLANDGKQSKDRIFNAMARCLTLHNRLGGEFAGLRATYSPPTIKLPNGSQIEAIPCDAAGEAGAEPLMTIWCFDNQTEVLTDHGWQTYDTIQDNHRVATLSADGMFEWQLPTAINVTQYDGPIWLGQSKRANLCVTPNHRVYGKYCKDDAKVTLDAAKWQIKATKDARAAYRLNLRTRCDGWEGFSPGEFTLPGSARKPNKHIPMKLFVQFMGWYLSEGCIQRKNGKPEGVDIGQSKSKNPENRAEIIAMFRQMGYEPHEWQSDMNIVVYDVRLGNYCNQFGYSHDKYVPHWLKNLPTAYLELFLEAYYKGDGHYDSPNSIRISTTSAQMKDDIMEIGAKLGYGVRTIHKGRPGPDGTYVITLQHSGVMPSIWRRQWQFMLYNGIVWCPSTPNGIIYVRRNGFACWQGNSELWGYAQKHKARIWTEMTIPPTLYGYAMRWVESYAGYSGESTVLEMLYNVGVNEGKRHPAFPDLPVYVNDVANQLSFWSHDARQPWQTQAYYDAEAKLLTPNEFTRIHRNQWVTSTTALFEDMFHWDRCKDTNIATQLPPGDMTPCIVAIDAGYASDTAAIVMTSRHPEDEWDAPTRRVVERYAVCFKPPKGDKLNFTLTIEPVLRRLAEDYNVYRFVYDPYQLHKLCTDLKMDGIGAFQEFNQMGRRLRADKQLYDMIVHKQYIHSGNPTVREHVFNAAKKEEGRHLRFVKKPNNLPIDLIVATSMAVDENLRLNT